MEGDKLWDNTDGDYYQFNSLTSNQQIPSIIFQIIIVYGQIIQLTQRIAVRVRCTVKIHLVSSLLIMYHSIMI